MTYILFTIFYMSILMIITIRELSTLSKCNQAYND